MFEVTPAVMREALHLPEHVKFDAPISDEAMKEFFRHIGYAGNLERLGKMTRPYWRKEWSFFFYSIVEPSHQSAPILMPS